MTDPPCKVCGSSWVTDWEAHTDLHVQESCLIRAAAACFAAGLTKEGDAILNHLDRRRRNAA